MVSIRPQIRRAGGYLRTAIRTFVRLPLWLAVTLTTQIRRTAANAYGFLGWLSVDRAFPPAVATTIKWLGERIPLALGAESSYQQVAAAGALLFGAATATLITFGLTVAIFVAMTPLLIIGLWRFNPIFNGLWTASRRKIRSRDGVSKPKWER